MTYGHESIIPLGVVQKALADPATAALPDGPLKRLLLRLNHEYAGYVDTPPVLIVRHAPSTA